MKTLKVNWKYLKYLFWLGPMLILAGLTAGVVAGTWGAVPLGLMIAGIVVIGLWFLFLSRLETGSLQPGFWGRRSTQAGTNAFVATLAVLTILGLINFLASQSVGRLDLTENQVFTLAPETQQIVRDLKQPVKVWVFDPQQNNQDRELLEGYQRLDKRFSFEFINPNAQPTLAQQFGVKKVGDVYVQIPASQRQQFVQNTNDQERLSEAKLTNAIAQVTNTGQAHVYFTQGHGERPTEASQESISLAVKGLQDRNDVVKPLNLAETSKFPTDASVVVVAGPQKSFLKPEVDALNTYLNRGGHVLLLLDPTSNPGLESLLSPWGITLDKRIVIDASNRVAGLTPADVTVTQYGDHPITKDFYNKLSYFTGAQAVDVKKVAGVESTPLLFTSDRTWAESDIKQQPLKFDPQSDRQGPLVLGFALSRPIAEKPAPTPQTSPNSKTSPSPQASPSPTPSASASPSPSPSPGEANKESAQKPESRLVVIGNSSFAADGYFNQVVNGDVFLNSVRWLSQEDKQTLSVRPKETKNRRITLSGQQANLIAWTSLVILPLIGFGTAFAVWWKRR
ncbi:Gldg family protein [Kovacikia minuta CCNUW1]|uniref:GldG family protein n=1 Tax=Kovacikia minuta TaxID=2931930 RepID=UPI001CCFD7CB|nr:Gldg family protein [Kovacikia minuta]UBF24079.1 Gldg family protein [Kovacikia minuta CCNUW1]